MIAIEQSMIKEHQGVAIPDQSTVNKNRGPVWMQLIAEQSGYGLPPLGLVPVPDSRKNPMFPVQIYFGESWGKQLGKSRGLPRMDHRPLGPRC